MVSWRIRLIRIGQCIGTRPMHRRWRRKIAAILVLHHGLHGTSSAMRAFVVVCGCFDVSSLAMSVISGVVFLAVLTTPASTQRRDLVRRVLVRLICMRRRTCTDEAVMLIVVRLRLRLRWLRLVPVLSRYDRRRVGMGRLDTKWLCRPASGWKVVLRHGTG